MVDKKCNNIIEFYGCKKVWELSEDGFKEVNLYDVYNRKPCLRVYWDGHAEDNMRYSYYFISKEKAVEYVDRQIDKLKDNSMTLYLDQLRIFTELLDMSESKIKMEKHISESFLKEKKEKIDELERELRRWTVS